MTESKEVKESKTKICLLADGYVPDEFVAKCYNLGISCMRFSKDLHELKLFEDIEHGDIFIIDISNDSFLARKRASGMHFYEVNYEQIKRAGYKITYYRTNGNIRKDNLPLLDADYIIGELPSLDLKTSREFFARLMYNKKPQVRSNATVFVQTLKKIL